MYKIVFTISSLLIGTLWSCSQATKADGYGNFEATEITVSSEANGKIIFLEVEEGVILESGTMVGLIDTTQLYLSKQQLLATKTTVASKSGNVWSQIKVLNEKLLTAVTEQERIKNMFLENAATQRQVDKSQSDVNVLKRQIQSVETQNAPIVNEVRSIDKKVQQINDLIEKSRVVNPIAGSVLTKYAEPNEITSFGKPLYKIADMREMSLRVYISETQLAAIEVGQEVTVKIDANQGMKSYVGTISWISDTAEFTPKIIQTKEERVNLVYAVKIRVTNDGSLKIGMPAEMWIGNEQ